MAVQDAEELSFSGKNAEKRKSVHRLERPDAALSPAKPGLEVCTTSIVEDNEEIKTPIVPTETNGGRAARLHRQLAGMPLQADYYFKFALQGTILLRTKHYAFVHHFHNTLKSMSLTISPVVSYASSIYLGLMLCL